MAGGMSTIAREELIRTIRSRYRESTKMEKTRILDELAAVVGCHRKHAIRLLGLSAEGGAEPTVARGRRIYDEAAREALIVVWETSDRICGKRLKAVLPSLIEAMEQHGHLDLDPHVRQRLVSASPATIDRLLKPIREAAGQEERASRQVPVRTFADWNAPPPGFLEIDLVAHCGGTLSGAFVHSFVATGVCSGWTEAHELFCEGDSIRWDKVIRIVSG